MGVKMLALFNVCFQLSVTGRGLPLLPDSLHCPDPLGEIDTYVLVFLKSVLLPNLVSQVELLFSSTPMHRTGKNWQDIAISDRETALQLKNMPGNLTSVGSTFVYSFEVSLAKNAPWEIWHKQ